MDIVVHGNYAPGNAGGALYNDILVPLIIVVLFAAYVGLQIWSKRPHNGLVVRTNTALYAQAEVAAAGLAGESGGYGNYGSLGERGPR